MNDYPLNDKIEAMPDPRGYVFIDCDGHAWGYAMFRSYPIKRAQRLPEVTP